jgi:hypothetical protein
MITRIAVILSGLKTLLETGELLTTPGSQRFANAWRPGAVLGNSRGVGGVQGGTRRGGTVSLSHLVGWRCAQSLLLRLRWT